jgi:hypothetical protein
MNTSTTGIHIPRLREVTLAKLTYCHSGELSYCVPGAREHSEAHIECFAETIRLYGGAMPVITNSSGGILAGQGRVEAARRLGFQWIPILWLTHLTEKERKHYVKTMTQFGVLAGWSRDMRQIDLQHVKKFRLSTLAKIGGRYFHANGKEQPIRGRPQLID